ncbi:hypothetical protein Dimus_008812 [Dionaea muscipula]
MVMASLFSLIFILLFFPSPPLSPSTATPQVIRSTRLLDLFIRDYTFKLYTRKFKTGVLHPVRLPLNLSGISVNTARFRCGSLRRYGVQIKEFSIGIGVSIHPCVERLVLITQNLGQNWSNSYYESFIFNGYHLITPILGIFAYNAGDDVNQSDPFELRIIAGENNPIKIDFSDVVRVNSSNWKKTQQPYCASFEEGGEGGGRKVVLAGMTGDYVCEARKEGHFGLVAEVEVPATEVEMTTRGEKRWKVAAGSAIGAALGAFLLGLLVVAMVARVKKREKMEDMARKAYEEEALQVSMAGHVRAPVAPLTRTRPTIEHQHRPPAC